MPEISTDRQIANGTLTMNAPSLMDGKIGPTKSPAEVPTSLVPSGLDVSTVTASRHVPDPALTVTPDDPVPTNNPKDVDPAP